MSIEHEPISDYQETLDYLFGLQKFGIKMGLENIKSLMHFLGNPHKGFPSIHIAGTNGKGSTSAFLASILFEAGYKTGLYTSPHLAYFGERIRINGIPISEDKLQKYVRKIRPEVDRLNATFFEATTAIALDCFADENVDIAVIETGMGGRLDATNVLIPVQTIITNLSLEHTEYLGTTIEQIAGEKAGIIKPRIPVLTAVHQLEALNLIKERSGESESPLYEISSNGLNAKIIDINHMKFDIAIDGSIQTIVSPLVGEHQVQNGLLAIHSAKLLGSDSVFAVTLKNIVDGIRNIRKNTGFSGRLERIGNTPELVIDVAHNPDGIRMMLETWRNIRESGRTHLVFGLLKSKDTQGILTEIMKYNWASVTAVGCSSAEARRPEEIVGASGMNLFIYDGGCVTRGVTGVTSVSDSKESILLFGSHYIIGEYLNTKKL